MRRTLAALLLTLTGVCASAADALILIRHDRAGPTIPEAASTHAEWVRWPAEFEPGSENGLLSIFTGLDWEGQRADLRFTSRGARTWVEDNFRSLANRGYVHQRALVLGEEEVRAVANPSGTASQEALLLAMGDSPTIHALRFLRSKQTYGNGLLLYDADDWGDARRLASRAGARTLVLEYPPPPDRPWTRFWRLGPGWPPAGEIPAYPDWGVAGLLPVRSSLTLLRHPDRFAWNPQPEGSHETADRWLEQGHTVAPVMLAIWFWLAIAAVVTTLYLTAVERRSQADRLFIQAVILGPAADVLAGNVAHATGLGAWPMQILLAEAALVGIASAVTLLLRSRFPALHSLLPAAALGLAVTTASSPVWSSFSNVLRWPETPISPEAAGCWMGYGAATYALARDLTPKGIWLARLATLTLLVVSIAFNPWWVGGQPSYVALPIIPLAAAEGLCYGLFLLVLALLPPSLVSLSAGLSWQPLFLTHSAGEIGRANGAIWARFLVSPGTLGAAPIAAALAVFGSGFGAYRLKSLIRRDPRRASVLWAAAGAAAMGLTQPWMLYAALVLAIGGILVLLYDAVD